MLRNQSNRRKKCVRSSTEENRTHNQGCRSVVGLLHVFFVEGLGDEACELAAAVELHAGELLADTTYLLADDDIGVGLGVGVLQGYRRGFGAVLKKKCGAYRKILYICTLLIFN